MKIELHTHTRRYSGCSGITPAELMARLIEAGYGAVYITEHDKVWNDWELTQLRDEFPAIRIFPGVELSLMDGSQHLLVLGTNDPAYLALRDDAPAALAKARAAGHLTVLAHPCRWPGGDALLQTDTLPDALEWHTCNQRDKLAERALAAAERLGLPPVNAGDVHAAHMVGRCWIETARAVESADEIRDIVLMGAYRNCLTKAEW